MPVTSATRRPIAITPIALIALFGASLTACKEPVAPPAEPRAQAVLTEADLAIVNVTLVPMDRKQLIPDRTVLIRDGSIVGVQAADKPVDEDARIIDGIGRYLMPGLIDMHVHLGSEDELPLYVANGITTVRNMFGNPGHLAMRERVAEGSLFGPTIFTTGPIIDGPEPAWPGSVVVTDPAQARDVVTAQRDAGYDFIKLYDGLSDPVHAALVTAAQARGMQAVGHVPAAVDIKIAASRGQQTIEHLSGVAAALGRAQPSSGPQPEPHSAGQPAEQPAARDDPMALPSPPAADDDPAASAARRALRDLGKHLVATNTYSVPTLTVLDHARAPQAKFDTLLAEPFMQYVPPATRGFWNSPSARARRTQADADAHAEAVAVYAEWTAALAQAGAPMLLGTDAPNPGVVPGFAIHTEIAKLIDAGLTPYQVLAAGTRDAARALGMEHRVGLVRVGQRADLLLLRDDPLTSPQTLRRPVGVVLRGRWHSQADLQTRLARVAERYASDDKPFGDLAPPEGDLATLEMRYNDVRVGAVRYVQDGASAVEQRAANFSGRVLSIKELDFDADGKLVAAIYVDESSSGQTAASIERAPDAVYATGTTPAGALSLREPVEAATRLDMLSMAEFERLLEAQRGIAVGASTQIEQVTFFADPQIALESNTLTLKRVAARDGAQRSFEFARDGQQPLTGVADLDADGLLAVDIRMPFGRLTLRRPGRSGDPGDQGDQGK